MQGMMKQEEEEDKEFNVDKFASEVGQAEEELGQELGKKKRSSRKSKSPKKSDIHLKNIEPQIQKNGDILFELTKRKKVQVRRYKDEILVDLREFYMNDIGEMCPSKKGFCFTLEQWENFKNIMPAIEEAITSKQPK